MKTMRRITSILTVAPWCTLVGICALISAGAMAVPLGEGEGNGKTGTDNVAAASESTPLSETPTNVVNEVDPYAEEDVDVNFMDMEDFYDDEEAAEWQAMQAEYNLYLKEERDRMIKDPAYRNELIEELKDEFPEGVHTMGHEDKSLYDLAMHLQAQELQAGKLRTKLDEAESRLASRRRRNRKLLREKDQGLRQLSQDELDRLLGDKPSLEYEAKIKRARRAAFLQREAGNLLALKKKAAQTEDLAVKAAIVSEHKKALDALSKKLGHAPGHLEQLKEVWEKEDGLLGIRFNPKTFFKLHDMNGDDAFDALEIQAIMALEARDLHHFEGKVDELAVKEEAHRMQEQMMEEYDENSDGLVDFNEFLTFAEGEGFIEDRAWHATNPEEELLEAMMGEDAHNELSAKDLKAFRKDPVKFLKDATGVDLTLSDK